MHTAVVQSANLDHRGALLDLLDCGAFLARLMVRVQGLLTFDAVDLVGGFGTRPLHSIIVRHVVEGATLTCYSHHLRLVAGTFQVRACKLILAVSLVILSLIYLKLGLRAAALNTARGTAVLKRAFEVLFLVATRGRIAILLGLEP